MYKVINTKTGELVGEFILAANAANIYEVKEKFQEKTGGNFMWSDCANRIIQFLDGEKEFTMIDVNEMINRDNLMSPRPWNGSNATESEVGKMGRYTRGSTGETRPYMVISVV